MKIKIEYNRSYSFKVHLLDIEDKKWKNSNTIEINIKNMTDCKDKNRFENKINLFYKK